MKDESSLISYQTLIKQLKHDDPYIAGCAAFSLGQYVHFDAAPVLREIAQNESSWVLGWVIFALGRIQDPQDLPIISTGLGDIDPWVREKSSEALANFQGTAANDFLLNLLNHKDSQIRAWSIYTITKRPSPDLESMDLIPMLEDESRSVRISAVRALYKLGDKDHLEQARMFINDPDIHLRGAANYALGILGNSSTVPDLLRSLRDPSAWVRRNAAWSIMQLGESLDVLSCLDEDPDTGVRTFARYAKKIIARRSD